MNDITHTARTNESCPIKPPAAKKRKLRDIPTLILKAGPHLQAAIDSIPSTTPYVRELVIQSESECECECDPRTRPKLTVPMPNLRTLHLENVAFEKIVLTPSLTPNLQSLHVQNIPNDCELTVQLPNLANVELQCYGPSDKDGWIHEMLATANKLESFESYNLQVGPELLLASNFLECVNMPCTKGLRDLTLYAPMLRNLNLEGCNLRSGRLTILDSYPGLPPPPLKLARFRIDATSTLLSPSILKYISVNPRVILPPLAIGIERDKE
jgi:hypothetical protein